MSAGPITEAWVAEHVRPRFQRTLQRNEAEIYLANHSLGRPLDAVAGEVQSALDLWYDHMDEAWERGWVAKMDEFRGLVAKLIGLDDPRGVSPKTSAGQGLRAVLNAIPSDKPRVLATRGEFDSVDFILKTYRERGRAAVEWVDSHPGQPPLFLAEDILAAIRPGIDLVVLSQVVFASGQLLPKLEEITAAAHRAGALVLIDAYHSAGVIPLEMSQSGFDFMIGGSYKYVRGGPGACWLAVTPEAQAMRTLDTGWFAKSEPFGFERSEQPDRASGGDGWLESTPSILPFSQACPGLRFTLEMGVDRLRSYSLEQLTTLREAFAERGVPCHQPDRPEDFGGFALVFQDDPKKLCRKLKELGVNVDARGPSVRFGPDILTTGAELARAAQITAEALAS